MTSGPREGSGTAARPRLGYHFTVPAGHVNDPLGVTWHDGRYDLFYQLNPDGPSWVPECRWGQADAVDLVRWRRPRTALSPALPGEGCWSGSVVVDPAGAPTIVYTSVAAASPSVGRVALARAGPDWSGWTVDAGGPVLGGPPPELDLVHFRDPFVWAAPTGWRMLLGGGTSAGRALVVQYSSPDLRTWREDGVLADGRTADVDPMEAGSVWECPQLFPLDGAWVLLVSAWDGEPRRVLAAVGDYDGRRFTPRTWQPFDATGEVYATTAFRDAGGRRCALSWVPPGSTGGATWAGALTVPYLLSLDGDRLRAYPHPDVGTLRTGVLTALRDLPVAGRTVLVGPVDPLLDVELEADVPAGSELVLEVHGQGKDTQLRLRLTGGAVEVERPDRPAQRLGDAVARRVRLRLLLDRGIAELATGDGTVAVLPADTTTGGRVVLTAASAGKGARVLRLTVHSVLDWYDGHAHRSEDSRR